MPTSPPRNNKKASEMFSIHKGKRVDDHIHNPILDNPEADRTLNESYKKRLREKGFSEESIARLAGSTDEGGSPPPNGFARGGPGSATQNVRMGSHPRHPAGMIKSSIPGRTDKIPMSVPPGSYILPADIPSAIGEGNTMAGEKILGSMFKIGPYGSGMTGNVKTGKTTQHNFNWMRQPRPVPRIRMKAEGGATEGGQDIPIIAAGGEMVLHPEQVAEIGNGDVSAGHKVLDRFVLSVRKRHIETLKKLKPPKT